MTNTPRNAPCPCGSGKKYKKCCLDKIIEFPKNDNFKEETPNFSEPTSDFFKMFQDGVSDKNFTSIEELNVELSRFNNNQNNASNDDFLGLSSIDIHDIIYNPFSLKNNIFHFECDNYESLIKPPLIMQSLYFLNRLKEQGSFKATKKGNLPKAFVIELYQQFFSNERYARLPHKEDDLPQVTVLKHLLDLAGLMKKRSNKFSLTKKGEKLINSNKIDELFNLLIFAFFDKWNWAYNDCYSQLPLMQSSAVFNLYLLHKKAQDWVLDEELGEIYLNAFPSLINEVESSYFTPEKEVIDSFLFRFLDRTCLPFGFLELKNEGKGLNRKTFYRVSPFFKRYFKFF